MASPLPNLVDNISQGTQKIKYTNCNKCSIEYTNFRDVLIELKCYYQEKFDEKLTKKFVNTRKFADQDINNLILLLRKMCLSIQTHG